MSVVAVLFSEYRGLSKTRGFVGFVYDSRPSRQDRHSCCISYHFLAKIMGTMVPLGGAVVGASGPYWGYKSSCSGWRFNSQPVLLCSMSSCPAIESLVRLRMLPFWYLFKQLILFCLRCQQKQHMFTTLSRLIKSYLMYECHKLANKEMYVFFYNCSSFHKPCSTFHQDKLLREQSLPLSYADTNNWTIVMWNTKDKCIIDVGQLIFS